MPTPAIIDLDPAAKTRLIEEGTYRPKEVEAIKRLSLNNDSSKKTDKPVLYVTAGAPRSGKSGIAYAKMQSGEWQGTFVDPDELFLIRFRDYRHALIGTSWEYLKRHEPRAVYKFFRLCVFSITERIWSSANFSFASAPIMLQKMGKLILPIQPGAQDPRLVAYEKYRETSLIANSELMNQVFAEQRNVVFGTTLFGERSLSTVKKFRDTGYNVNIAASFAPEADCLRRNALTMRMSLPKDVIEKRGAFLANLPAILDAGDKVEFYWNPDSAKVPIVAAVYEGGKFIVRNEDALNALLRDCHSTHPNHTKALCTKIGVPLPPALNTGAADQPNDPAP